LCDIKDTNRKAAGRPQKKTEKQPTTRPTKPHKKQRPADNKFWETRKQNIQKPL